MQLVRYLKKKNLLANIYNICTHLLHIFYKSTSLLTSPSVCAGGQISVTFSHTFTGCATSHHLWDRAASQNVTNNFFQNFSLPPEVAPLWTFCQRNPRKGGESPTYVICETASGICHPQCGSHICQTESGYLEQNLTFFTRKDTSSKTFFSIYFTLKPNQAVCTYGRENFESWGRKKRSLDVDPARCLHNIPNIICTIFQILANIPRISN